MRAVTDMDSGLDRWIGACTGIEPGSKLLTRFLTDPALSRWFAFRCSGEDSWDPKELGVLLLMEFARSAMDGPGDREGTRTLAFLTE
jgi:hypothetical protein